MIKCLSLNQPHTQSPGALMLKLCAELIVLYFGRSDVTKVRLSFLTLPIMICDDAKCLSEKSRS